MSSGDKTTKPKISIAAMYCSPGPAYSMPSLTGHRNHDPRSAHTRSPAYHIGMRWRSELERSKSPGPRYIDSSLSNKGRHTAPAYTMCGRRKDDVTDKHPGPSDYVCGNPTFLTGKHRAPSFTFGVSRKERDVNYTPGPNHYVLDFGENPQYSKLRRSPKHTIVGRRAAGGLINLDHIKMPGPGAYPAIDVKKYLRSSPAYTIPGRNGLSRESTGISPSPLSYATEKVNSTLRQSPKYSFGIRHSPYVAPLIVEPLY